MSYIICFWDKSKLQVSDETAEKLKEAIREERTKSFELKGNLYMISSVEKIISKQDAYITFPTEWEYIGRMEDVPTNQALLESTKHKQLTKN